MSEPRRRSPSAINSSVKDKLRTASTETGRTTEELKIQFVMQRFLARIFATDPHGWVLKGGTGMLVRLRGDARHTKDVDLVTASTMPLEAALDLLDEALANNIDPLRFTRVSAMPRDEGDSARVVVNVTIGGTVKFHTFHIDLVTNPLLTSAVESASIQPVIEVTEFATPSPIQLFSLPDQIAEKLCALYERPNTNTRVHDLVDLLLIALHFDISLEPAVAAIQRQLPRRQGLELPDKLVSPNAAWQSKWAANSAKLPSRLHVFAEALNTAALCYSPILAAVAEPDNPQNPRRWSCRTQTWE